MNNSKKRLVSSCLPCYTRKQKCSREIPCNHCTRRKCPEACVYTLSTTTSNHETTNPVLLPGPSSVRNEQVESHSGNDLQQHATGILVRSESDGSNKQLVVMPSRTWSGSKPKTTFPESLGYSQHSTRNTLALLKKLGVGETNRSSHDETTITSDALKEVRDVLQNVPDRRILDFLVQFFVSEIAWIDQLVCVRWFLAEYRTHSMSTEGIEGWFEVDFINLTLRICSYAMQFLPSPTYPLDRIRGVSLSDIRHACDDVADRLQVIKSGTGSQGTLLTVQQLTFSGLKYQVEGKFEKFWELLGQAIRVALRIGLHGESMSPQHGMTSAEQVKMARWVFCNLYTWDSQIMRQLDCIPAIPDQLCPRKWLDLHTRDGRRASNDSGRESQDDRTGTNGPDPFMERVQQTRLAALWRTVSPQPDADYDVMEAEERYSRFCSEFLPGLPACLALSDPDERWDQSYPEVPLQRQVLRMAIYDWICWNFRPLLLWRPTGLPAYKAVLVLSQKKALAAAALQALQSVSRLHALLGNRHTRLAGIVVSTFEATVVLLTLLMDPSYPEPCIHTDPQHRPAPQHPSSYSNPAPASDPLQAAINEITRASCFQAAQTGLMRLQMLAEVSTLAEQCAETIVQLMNKLGEKIGNACPRNANPNGPNKRNRQEYVANPIVPVTSVSSAALDHSVMTTTTAPEMTNWLPAWPEPMGYLQDTVPEVASTEISSVGPPSWSFSDTPPTMLSNASDYMADATPYYHYNTNGNSSNDGHGHNNRN